MTFVLSFWLYNFEILNQVLWSVTQWPMYKIIEWFLEKFIFILSKNTEVVLLLEYNFCMLYPTNPQNQFTLIKIRDLVFFSEIFNKLTFRILGN